MTTPLRMKRPHVFRRNLFSCHHHRFHHERLIETIGNKGFTNGSVQRRRVLEIGSGSIKCQVSDVNIETNRIVKTVAALNTTVLFTRDLKRQLDKSSSNVGSSKSSDVGFSASIQQDGIQAIRTMLATTDVLQPDRTVGVATEAFRQATNGRQFATMIRNSLHIPVTIVPVDVEAGWGFQTAVAISDSCSSENIISWDCGAGSFQFTTMYHGTHVESQGSGTVEALSRHLQRTMPNKACPTMVANELLRILKDEVLDPIPRTSSSIPLQQAIQSPTFQIIAIGSQHSIFNQQRISSGRHVFNRLDVRRCLDRAVSIESISTDRLIEWELQQSRRLQDGDDDDRDDQRCIDNAPYLVPKLVLLLAIMEHFNIRTDVTFYKTNGNCHALLTQQPWLWE